METGNFLKTLFILELIILASFVFQEEREMQMSMFWKDQYEKQPSQTCFFPPPATQEPLFNFLIAYWPTGVSIKQIFNSS